MKSVAVEMAAVAFVMVFELIAQAIGRARALLDARVQAARRYWIQARCGR